MSAEPTGTLSVEQLIFVRGLFGSSVGNAAQQLAAIMREVFFAAGTVIFAEGETSEHLYFIVDGEVTMTAPGEDAWSFRERELIGMLDAVLERPHARTATAVTDVRALVVAAEDWFELIEDHFELTRDRLLRNVQSLLEMGLSLSPPGGFAEAGEAAPARRRDLHFFERLLALRRSALFERARMQPLLRLAHEAEARWVPAGTVLFRQGDHAHTLCLVAEGLVAIERETPPCEAAFGPGSLVGGYAGLCLERRPFTATAATDAIVVEIRHERLDDVMEDHFDLLRSVMAFLALERERLQRLRGPTSSRSAGWGSIPPPSLPSGPA